MSWIAKDASLISHLLCPHCRRLVERVNYYKCPQDHSICGLCYSKKRKCPTCDEAYEKPPARDYSLEEQICQAFRDYGYKCPFAPCEKIAVLAKMRRHIKRSHPVSEPTLLSYYPGHVKVVTDTIFAAPRIFNLSYEFAWPVYIVRVPDHEFYICRKISIQRNCFLMYVVMNDPKDVAECYKVTIHICKDRMNVFKWTGRVFSVSEKRTGIWESPECMEISESVLSSAWVPRKDSSGGYDCRITVRIRRTFRPVKEVRTSLKGLQLTQNPEEGGQPQTSKES